MMSKCECGNTLSNFDTVCITLESADMGVYYKGKPLCDKCRVDKYEEARAYFEIYGKLNEKEDV